MNRWIRQAAGRGDPREIAAAAIAAAEHAGDASALRERLAEQAGLPASLGARLEGQNASELKADAESLAETLAELRPTPPPQDLNSRIRRFAGRDTAQSDPPKQPSNEET